MTPGVLLLGGLGGGRPQQLPFLVMGLTSMAAVAVAATVRAGKGGAPSGPAREALTGAVAKFARQGALQ